jgi:RND family efflux transporter MFP subunit
MNGQIKAIHVSEGKTVDKGQLLLSLNTAAIEGQIRATKSSLELAKSTFEKQEALFKQGIGSEIQYLSSKTQVESLEAQLDALMAQMRMSQIRAPFKGTVNKIYPKVGEIAGPGFPVLEFVNLSEITILADVSESYIGLIKLGDEVEVSFSALPDEKRKSKIVRASKVINNLSRTFEIELKLKNPDGLIKPNMVSTIHINDYKNKNAYVIPSLAIRKDITGNYVYLVEPKDGKDIVAKKYIKTSKSYQDNTMVKNGINQGDNVIVKGFHMVSSGIPVRIVN